MNYLLQISIPTYNRISEVNKRVVDLVKLKARISPGQLLISVYDNSTQENVELKAYSKFGEINYEWNEENIGFSANIKKCFQKSAGIFTWIISDDDDINYDELISLINYLNLIHRNIKGVAVPYLVGADNSFSGTVDIALKQIFNAPLQFNRLVLKKRMPFDFLASFIIRTELLNNSQSLKNEKLNDYIHALILCECLNSQDEIIIYGNPLVTYKGGDFVRWSLIKLIQSKYEICDTLQRNHNIEMDKSYILFEILKWAVFCHSGMVNIENYEKERRSLIIVGIQDKHLKNFLLSILLILPRKITKELVIAILIITGEDKLKSGLIKKISRIRNMFTNANNV